MSPLSMSKSAVHFHNQASPAQLYYKCYSKCYLTSNSLKPDTHLYLYDKLFSDKENSIQFTFKRNQWHFFSNINFKTDMNKDEKSRISQIHACHQLFYFIFFTFINEEYFNSSYYSYKVYHPSLRKISFHL